MKNLFNLLILTSLITALSSCGKDNKSGGGGGGGGGSVTSPVVVAPTNWYANNANDPTNSVNYNTLRNYYEARSFATGLSANLVIYHLGPAFDGAELFSSSMDYSNLFNFDFGYCINWFGKLKGDCSNTQNNQFSNQASDIIKKGEYKVVINADQNTTNYDKAIDSSNLGFEFEARVYDRNDVLYRQMLNLDAKPVVKVVISKATVNAQITDANGTNSATTINADYVEYFFSDNTIEGYVISPDLPMLANPIAVTKKNNYDTHALRGILSYSGNLKILSLTVDTHLVNGNAFGGNGFYQAQTIDAGSRTITINNPY